QALLALAVYNNSEGKDARAGVLVRNLETTARRDDARGTAHWEGDNTAYWRWYNDKEETTAMVLRALVRIAPQEQLAPLNGPHTSQTGLAPLAVRRLVDNRRGGRWASTPQTANVVNALLE